MKVAFYKDGVLNSPTDFAPKGLSLDSLIIKHPEATFFIRVEGDNHKKWGISNGDILIVDKSLYPKEGSFVIVFEDDLLELCLFNASEFKKQNNFTIWGVVSYIFRKTY